MGSEVSADTGGFRAGGDRTDDVLALVERVVLGWPGVWKKRDEDGPGGVGVTGYRLGRKQIGHVHDDGHADFRFPKEVRDGLIRSGKATAHPAFPNSRTTASYRVRGEEDVPGALQLFKMNYERLKEAAERKAERVADGREKNPQETGRRSLS